MEIKPSPSEALPSINEKLRKCARLITLIGTHDDFDKGAILTSFKKNAKSKFIVLSPDMLIESAKKKPEWGDELKKLQGKQTIEQTLQQSPQFRDILQRLIVAKVEECDPKVVKEEPKKEVPKKQKKKKDEVEGKKEEVNKETEAEEKKTPTGSTKGKRPLQAEEYPFDGPENYIFITTECIRSLEDIKILKDRGVSLDIIANFKKVEVPVAKSSSQIVPSTNSSPSLPRNPSSAHLSSPSIMKELKIVIEGGNVTNSTLEMKHLSESIWIDILVDEQTLPVPTKEVKDIYGSIFDDLSKRIFEVVSAKNRYQDHLENIIKVNFPLPVVEKQVRVIAPSSITIKQPNETFRETPKEPSLPHISSYKQYNKLMNGIHEEAISVSLVLNSIIEEVAYTGERRITPEEEFAKKVQDMEEYLLKSFNKATLHVIEKDQEAVHTPGSSVMQLYSEEDKIGVRTLDHKDINAESLQSIERAFHQRIVKVPTFGRNSITETEDEIEDLRIERAEFLTFSSFHRTKVEQCFLLFEAEDMINEHLNGSEEDKKVKDEERIDVSFMDRDFVEEFNKETLLQVLDKALRTKPEVVSEYYPYEDGLLLSIYTRVPFQRISNVLRWDPVNSTNNILFNSGFGKWHKLNQPSTNSMQRSNSTSSSGKYQTDSPGNKNQESNNKAILYDLDEASVNFTEENYVLFPSNGSFISLSTKRYPTPGPASSKKDTASIKASVYTSGEVVFGISSVHVSDGNNGKTLLCNFTANFDDGLTVWCGRENSQIISESKLPPINVACSLANGLVVSHSFTEATITQLYLNGITNRSNSTSKAEALRLATFHAVPPFNNRPTSISSKEVSRTLLLGKSVSIVRQFDDGSKEILFANGNSSVYQPEVGWTVTNPRGTRTLKKDNGEELTISPIGVAIKTNCETGELVINRQDMVKISRAKNNSKLSVIGPDGTCITTINTGAGVTVEINSPDFATTVVDISPNLVATSRTFLPNGSVIAFNTKSCEITSLSKVGPISILADEKSFVILREPTAGEYSFDCQTGAIEMSDSRNNNYRISPNGTPNVTLSQTEKRLIRAQSMSDVDEDIDYLQYITHPPRLFLLKSDGSGIEFVRSKDALTYIQSRQKEASGNYKVDERFLSSSKEVQLLVEESENTDSSKIYTVLTKYKYSRGDVIAFRQLAHRPLISKEQQDVLLDELERFEKMKQSKPSKGHTASEEELNAFHASQEKIEELLKTKTFQAIPVEVKVLENIQNEESRERQRELLEREEEERRKLEELERKKKQSPQKVINKERREQLAKENEKTKSEKPISKLNYFEFEDGLKFLNSKQAVIPVRATPPVSVSPNTPKEKINLKELSPPTTPKHTSLPKVVTPGIDLQTRKPSTASSIVDSRQPASAPATYQRSQSHPTTPANKKYDVYGNDRSQPPVMPLPFLQSPGEPNQANQADAVIKRKVHISSTKMGEYSQLFALFPTKVDFGKLKQGNSYKTHLSLTNVGFDTGRFKVQAPSNLKVSFLKGPVAPGITAKIDLEINSQEVGQFEYELNISTECEVFKVPITVQVSSDSEAVAKGITKVNRPSPK